LGQITVFSGPERRRRWSEAERLQILTEAFRPGACVARVARQHDVSTALIYSKRCFGSTLPALRSVIEVRGWTRPALRLLWTPTLECL